jgi:hypothetical protein
MRFNSKSSAFTILVCIIQLGTIGFAQDSTKAAVGNGELLPLNSTYGVFTPPKGKGALKFSFNWPEPSFEFASYLFSFRVQTFENAYAIDPTLSRVERSGDLLRFSCQGFTWAGGQEKAQGKLIADFSRTAEGNVEWHVSAKMDQSIKSITTIVRGVPRGELSLACEGYFDPGYDEVTYEYPVIGGRLSTPLIVIKTSDGDYFGLSAIQYKVRPARFFFQPGPHGYRIEMIYEQAGWDKQNQVESYDWRIAKAKTYETIAKEHFEHMASAYGIPNVAVRKDIPDWMRQVRLVASLHGEDWTGYINNDYARQLEILRWIATKIDPKYVLAFLPAWDGRYYWNYPLYEPDVRMGGAKGFKELIDEGHKLGFHFSAMFGANVANSHLSVYKELANATTMTIDNEIHEFNVVDFDNDRQLDGWLSLMNIALPTWRNFLEERIAHVIDTYRIDSYFLDIAGAWENNTQGDMLEGTRKLVSELATRYPRVMPIGEFYYDALMGVIPVYQVPLYPLYVDGADKHVIYFDHLSHPAPGRGSTGVHEYGFSNYVAVTKDQRAIPTITFADDTFEKHRDLVEEDIAMAMLRSQIKKQ